MPRFLHTLSICLFATLIGGAQPGLAQTQTPVSGTSGEVRAETGGATTLEDIMARQRGQAMDNSQRAADTGSGHAAAIDAQLGTRGSASDSDVFRALRFGNADIRSTVRGPSGQIVIQDDGMEWLTLRRGPIATYGSWLLGGMLVLLLLFYLIRGKIRIDGPKTGHRILRFTSIERFGHWLLGGSFILLGLTGLYSLFGRKVLIPLLGKDSFASVAAASKWVHNNVAWAFMVGLVLVIVMWIAHNIPNRHDLKWLAQAGGLFSKHSHPPARKFNAGQKIIFWAVVILGISISLSGLALLFPFELPMFAKTFRIINDLGLPQLFGQAPLPDAVTPIQEMQLSQLWHTVIAFVFIAVILAHIYLGSVGMEGAYDAMGSGLVEEQWAREHHSLWVEEVEARQAEAAGVAKPAE